MINSEKKGKILNILKIYIFPVLCVGLIILIDQLTKLYFKNNYFVGQKTEIIPGFFDFKYVQNTGSAFSLLADKSWGQLFFKIITPIALLVMCVFYYFNRKGGAFFKYGMAFIIGGTIGNFIDRIAYSFVVDFLSFTFGTYKFAVFNIADSFLCVGIVMIFIHLLFLDKDALFRKKKKNSNEILDKETVVELEEKVDEKESNNV